LADLVKRPSTEMTPDYIKVLRRDEAQRPGRKSNFGSRSKVRSRGKIRARCKACHFGNLTTGWAETIGQKGVEAALEFRRPCQISAATKVSELQLLCKFTSQSKPEGSLLQPRSPSLGRPPPVLPL
jgi:hypothetical protein